MNTFSCEWTQNDFIIEIFLQNLAIFCTKSKHIPNIQTEKKIKFETNMINIDLSADRFFFLWFSLIKIKFEKYVQNFEFFFISIKKLKTKFVVIAKIKKNLWFYYEKKRKIVRFWFVK